MYIIFHPRIWNPIHKGHGFRVRGGSFIKKLKGKFDAWNGTSVRGAEDEAGAITKFKMYWKGTWIRNVYRDIEQA